MDADRTAALAHMYAALDLLERAGAPLAAVRLQHAIDTAEGAQAGAPTADQLERFEASLRRRTALRDD